MSIELPSDAARAFPFEWMFSFNYRWCLPVRAVSIELPSNVTIAFRSSKPWPFSMSTGKAYPSDAVSIELPSDAARASWSGKPWLFRPSTGEAYPSDAVSIELPSNVARAFWICFSFNYRWCLPAHAVSIELPSNVARAFWICFSFNYRWCLPVRCCEYWAPVGCCESLPVTQTLLSVCLPVRLNHPMLWVLNSCQMLRKPPDRENIGISICLPAKLTRPMLWVLSSRRMLWEPPSCTTLTFPSVYRRGLAIWCSEYWTPVGCCESLPVAQPWLLRPSTGEAYPSNAVSIELPSDAARASRSGKPWLFHPSTGEAEYWTPIEHCKALAAGM